MPKERPFVIVWDLDRTLGEFSSLEETAWDVTVTVQIRPGLPNALERLSQAGFLHTVLTMASASYAEAALRGTGLRPWIERVDAQGQRRKGDAKGIAEHFGIPESEISARMIFVGDRLIFDEPNRKDVLFHFEPYALARHADELERLLLRLRDAGAGSLLRGFDKLAGMPRPWWRLLNRQSKVDDEPIQKCVQGLGDLLFVRRSRECPVVAFTTQPQLSSPPHFSFVPDEVLD